MQYFVIKQETEFDIIGTYPQIKELTIKPQAARIGQWGKISKWQSDEDIPDLNSFKLNHLSKLTDSLSNNFVVISSGLLISQKARLVLEQFKVNGSFHNAIVHRHLPATKTKEEYPYNLLWYEYDGRSQINWTETVFAEYYTLKDKEKIKNTGPIADLDDYRVKFKKLHNEHNNSNWLEILPETLVLKQQFDITPAFSYGLICNEKVKKTIEDNQLTGFVFIPIDFEILFKES
nr:hypothetical protein [uncultured Flavobacterium sp.]